MIDLRHTALDSDESYRIVGGTDEILTPALVIYPEIVEANIAATLHLLDGDPNRWRPHVKTAKLASVMRRLVDRDIRQFKCATALELVTACAARAEDVLLAYPVVGAQARRVREIAGEFPETRISVLVENAEQVQAWAGSRIGLFIDVNPGMNRTGIGQERAEAILDLARAIVEAGLAFRGVHYYDGHTTGLEPAEREAAAHRGYDRLIELVAALARAGLDVPEAITAGTPALPYSLSYAAFRSAPFVHRVSPGTVVYSDCTSLMQLPQGYGYRPAAVVVTTVVSRPTVERITCDAGHKAVSADMGVPTCAVLGRPDLRPLGPSEEHLPLELPEGALAPTIGATLYLVPRHVCPTVNNFDYALLVNGGRITGVERVTARGHEGPLLARTGAASKPLEHE